MKLSLALVGLLLGAAASAAPPAIVWAADSGVPREDHGAALLPDGRVLVEGGYSPSSSYSQLYDPAADSWIGAGDSIDGHAIYSLARLRDGTVMVVDNSPDYEWWSLADPVWSVAPSGAARQNGVAVLLSSGRLLTACGDDGTDDIGTFECFDPEARIWSDAGTQFAPGSLCAVSPLPGDRWLKTGGTNSASWVAELWSASGGQAFTLQHDRVDHTSTVLPDGRVLITGGTDTPAPVEIFDPGTETWEDAGAAPSVERYRASATVLPDGRVLVAGGYDEASNELDTAEVYDPVTGSWLAPFRLGRPRASHLAVMLPNGRVLLTGGDSAGEVLESSELLDFSSPFVVAAPGFPQALVKPRLGVARGAVILWDDKGTTAAYRLGVEGRWMELPPPPPNPGAVALTLADGRLLRVGAAVDGFDPGEGVWFTLPASPATGRARAAAALLGTGEVLVAGGEGLSTSAEVLDPRAATWSATEALPYPVRDAQAVSLPGGDVLLCGGESTSGVTNWCWVYSVSERRWATGVRLGAPRRRFSLTLLESGKVLAAGGENDAGLAAGVEVFEPASARWIQVGPLMEPRSGHAAVRLRNGQVLVIGGAGAAGALKTTERYDPVAHAFSAGPELAGPRASPAVAMAADGQVLICGAEDRRLERFDEGRGAELKWAPLLAEPPRGSPGGTLTVTGDRFTGVTPGSSGSLRDSPSDLPVLALVGADGVLLRPGAVAWTPTSVTFQVPQTATPGWYTLSASVNGIESGAQPFAIGLDTGQPCNASPECTAGACTGSVCVAPPEIVWQVPDAGTDGGTSSALHVGCGCASAPGGVWSAILLAVLLALALRQGRRSTP